MPLITTRGKGDCGIACAAMGFGLSYEVAKSLLPNPEENNRGIFNQDLIKLGLHLGWAVVTWPIEAEDDRGIVVVKRDDFFPTINHRPAFLVVHVPRAHLVFWDGYEIYDPRGYIRPIEGYVIEEALLIFKIQS